MTATNGTHPDASHRPATFLQQQITERVNAASPELDSDRSTPPNNGQFAVPHVVTFQGLISSIAKVYRPSDEALKDSYAHARYMRNDTGIMESLEARQRATSLLKWHLEPENEHSQSERALAEEMTKILNRIKRFNDYRYNLLHGLWYGRYGIQHQNRWVRVSGKSRVMPAPHPIKKDGYGWLPINGDKLVFRHDDVNFDVNQYAGQVGIRVATHWKGQQLRAGERIEGRQIEQTDRGLAYFLSPAERNLLAIHKHMIEDGAYEAITDAGMIHGVGIRSRIYWDWFQKQQALAFLMEYLERSAGGIELWFYDAGNPTAKANTEEAATKRVGNRRNVLLVPWIAGQEGVPSVQVIEPGMAGIDQLKDLLTNYFGHRIKRYILGQVLSSEAEATGLGSGVAELHLDTFLQIVRYDARNLEETITDELVTPILNWNFPAAKGVQLRFKIETESPDTKEKLEACHLAWTMGARIKERDVLDQIGAGEIGPDDRVLQNPQAMQAQQAPQQPGTTTRSFPAAKTAPNPATVAKDMADSIMQGVYGTEEAQDRQIVAYVSEAGEWEEREVPSAEHDTGDRRRAERYSKTADEAAAETDANPSDEQKAAGNAVQPRRRSEVDDR